MHFVRTAIFLALLAALLGCAGGAAAASRQQLDMYSAVVDAKTAARVAASYDVARSKPVAGGIRLDLVLTPGEANRVRGEGVKLGLIRNGNGQTVREQAAAQAAGGYTVFRSYDERGGIRDELYALAKKYPQLVKLEVIGHTLQGREIIALKVTKNAKTDRGRGTAGCRCTWARSTRASGSRPR